MLRAVPPFRGLAGDSVFAAVFKHHLRVVHERGAWSAAAALSPVR